MPIPSIPLHRLGVGRDEAASARFSCLLRRVLWTGPYLPQGIHDVRKTIGSFITVRIKAALW